MLNYNRTILVIGGSSCIGTHFVEYLVDKYERDRVVVLDKDSNNSLAKISDKIVFECFNVNDNKIYKLFEIYKFDVVISFVSCKKIRKICNDYAIRYLLVLSWYENYEDADIVVRLSHYYGECQNLNCNLSKMIVESLKQNLIFVKNDGTIIRDWIHVLDCCRAIDKLLDFGEVGQLYSIKSDFKISDRDVARMILKKLELPLSFVEYEDAIELQKDFTDSNNNLVPQWLPIISFEEGLDKLIIYIKKQLLL